MKQGFVWYDNDPGKSLETKLKEASQRFKSKFGVDPTICYLNGTALKGGTPETNLKVITAPSVLPNHLWFEIEK